MTGELVLQPADVIIDLKASSRDEALAELADRLAERQPSVSSDELLRLLLDRESLGSTGIGEGLAIPHCKSPAITSPVLLFARSSAGIDFRAVDGRPVHLIFLLVAPEGAAGLHLKLLARLSRLLKEPMVRTRLMTAATPEEVSLIVGGQESRT